MSVRTPLIAWIAVALFSTEVSARSFLEFSGDTISHVGDINNSKGTLAHFGGRPDGVGYKYTFYGLMLIDFWRDGGQFCVYKDEEYFAISNAEAASLLGIPEDELYTPFLYRFPPGLLILGILLMLGLFTNAVVRINRKEEPDAVTQVYREALEVFRQTVRRNRQARKDAIARGEHWTEVDPWEAAISFLIAAGLDKALAEDHLSGILADAIASPNKAA